VGPWQLEHFLEDKCHGRPELACSPRGSSMARPVCLPQCNRDDDCGDGRFCHPKDGLCRATPAVGLPIGSPCDAGADACRGTCAGSDEGSFGGLCTEWCTEGTTGSCGGGGYPYEAACLLALPAVYTRGGPGFGDLSLCLEPCDVDSDCSDPTIGCYAFGIPGLAQGLGRAGARGVQFAYGDPSGT
jgi:hypothetical protein